MKFHDDKNLYTGVHANGGPSTIDKNHGGLNTICDRSAADVRGVKKWLYIGLNLDILQ